MDVFYRANVKDGLFHEMWFIEDGTPSGSTFIDELNHFSTSPLLYIDHFTIGPPSDSGYEYLLKQWIQSGDPKARQQCKAVFLILNSVFFFTFHKLDIASATGIINKLIYQTPTRGLLYVVDTHPHFVHHRLQSLSCYLPGVLALGASTLPDTELSPKEKEIHRWAAHGLAYTCAIIFADQETGLGPEEIVMSAKGTRWMEAVDEWKLGGRQGDVPPGMGEPEPERNPSRRDYDTLYTNDWRLRPEVKNPFFIF